MESGSYDRTVRLWNAQTGAELGKPLEGHTRGVTCVSLSPDGRQVVSGSHDGTLMLWDAETCAEIGNPFEGHSDSVYCVCFSCDGHRIVSGGLDKTVRVWNVATREQIWRSSDWTRAFGHVGLLRVRDGRFVVSRDWNETSFGIGTAE